MRITVFGDSITAGVALHPGQLNWPDLLGELLQAEVLTKGTGGCTSEMALSRWDSEVAPFPADFIILEYGMNDHVIWGTDGKPAVSEAQFYENMAQMIYLTRQIGAVPILVTPNRVMEELYYTRHDPSNYAAEGGANIQLKKYADILCCLGEKEKVPVVDIFRCTENCDLSKLVRTEEHGGFPDGVHPYGDGIRLYAKCIAEVIRNFQIESGS